MSKARRSSRARRSDVTAEFENLLKQVPGDRHYVLRLYVTGTTPRSARAIATLRAVCEEYLDGRYDLEVIDIYQQPGEAASEQIIAAPTLVKKEPQPPRRIVGDLADRNRVLVGLDLRTQDGDHAAGDVNWPQL